MNINESLYQLLKQRLIEWKPEVDGIGWNEDNVLDIEPMSIPEETPFDFLHIGMPTKNETPVTTGSPHIQQSVQTFTVDIYSRRAGAGNAMKRATKQAIEENTEFVTNFFASLGFTAQMPNPDLNYSGNSTARQPIYFTRLFVQN